MTGEILASLSDINTFLPDDKALMGDADDDSFQIDTDRIIKGSLAGVFQPTTLAAWTAPDNTPALIRGIAGRMIAARWYARLYSEDDTIVSTYAQSLYQEAVGMINDVRGGILVVLGIDDNPVDTNLLILSDAVFWPNDSTSGPFFAMDTEFG